MIAQEVHPVLVPVTLGMLHGVLEQEGHAAEWRAVVPRGGFFPGPLEAPEHHRVDGRVEPFDPCDGQFGQLGRRNLTRAHQLRLTHGVDPVQFVPVHHARSPHHGIAMPPFGWSVWPVMKRAASEAR